MIEWSLQSLQVYKKPSYGLDIGGNFRSFAVWAVNSGGPTEARVQSYSPDGANVPDDIMP